jgi:SAM-dependent methyltransferase
MERYQINFKKLFELIMFFKKNQQQDFSAAIYKLFNTDLAHLSDVELHDHFEANKHENRIYKLVSSDVEFLSMRWLRGKGLEIGAGSYPTPLFGNASVTHADCDVNLAFGGTEVNYLKSLDAKDFSENHYDEYDFVIASHVLEHCDSFVRAIENLISIVKKNGFVYIVLPNIKFLNDINFIDDFDFQHHIEEYEEPLKYSKLHDKAHISACVDFIEEENPHALISDDYRKAIQCGFIPQTMRFMYHKHNYDFEGWIDLIRNTQKYLGDKSKLVDLRYGHLRNDCHFIIQKN